MRLLKVAQTDMIDEDGNKQYKHLKDYFGCNVYFDINNIIELKGSHNYYDPIKIEECSKKDAHFHFASIKNKVHCYYKFVNKVNYEVDDKL
jgi:hypothetical protein